MFRRLRAKLRKKTERSDPETKRRTETDRERESSRLWKLRTPPLPRR